MGSWANEFFSLIEERRTLWVPATNGLGRIIQDNPNSKSYTAGITLARLRTGGEPNCGTRY